MGPAGELAMCNCETNWDTDEVVYECEQCRWERTWSEWADGRCDAVLAWAAARGLRVVPVGRTYLLAERFEGRVQRSASGSRYIELAAPDGFTCTARVSHHAHCTGTDHLVDMVCTKREADLATVAGGNLSLILDERFAEQHAQWVYENSDEEVPE